MAPSFDYFDPACFREALRRTVDLAMSGHGGATIRRQCSHLCGASCLAVRTAGCCSGWVRQIVTRC